MNERITVRPFMTPSTREGKDDAQEGGTKTIHGVRRKGERTVKILGV